MFTQTTTVLKLLIRSKHLYYSKLPFPSQRAKFPLSCKKETYQIFKCYLDYDITLYCSSSRPEWAGLCSLHYHSSNPHPQKSLCKKLLQQPHLLIPRTIKSCEGIKKKKKKSTPYKKERENEVGQNAEIKQILVFVKYEQKENCDSSPKLSFHTLRN